MIRCALLTDRQGAAPQRVVSKTKGAYLAHSLNGLLVAPQHADENPTGAELFTTLGKAAPFVSLAVGSVALSPGAKLSVWDPGGWTGGNTRGRGDAEQTRLSLEAHGGELLSDVSARLFPAVLDPERSPLAAEIFIPFPRDQRYQTICEGLELWAAETVPGTTLVFIGAPGVKDDAVETHYRAQWTWYYSFDVEQALAHVVTPRGGLVRDDDTLDRPLSGGSAAEPMPVFAARRTKPAATVAEREGKTANKRKRRTPLRTVEPWLPDDSEDDQEV